MPRPAGHPRTTVPSLAHRLAMAFAALAALGALLLLAVIVPAETARLEAQQRHVLTQAAVVAARALDRTMEERYQDVLLTRSLIEMHSGTPAQQRRVLEHLRGASPEFAWIGVTDAAGHVRAATGGLLEGVSVARRPWFLRGRRGPIVEDVHPALLLAAVLPKPANGEPLRFIDISAPILDPAGRVVGVLGGHLSWAWAQSVERDALALTGNAPAVEVLILNRQGEVIHGPAPLLGSALPGVTAVRRASPGAQGTVAATWDGQPYVAGYAVTGARTIYPGLSWRVVVRQNAAVVQTQSLALRRQIELWGVMGVAVSALVAYLAARAVSRPLGVLTVAAQRLAHGGDAPGLPRVRQYAEVDHLSSALQDLWDGRRAAQLEQAQLTATLEHRIVARTAQLTESNAALDAFTASVSHDLRAPIRHVAGYTAILRRALAQGDTAKVERAVNVIEQAATHMGVMTDALLEFARTSQEPVKRHPVDLGAVVTAARGELAPDMDGLGVEWHVEPLPTVLGDATLLQQVMANLLSNAVKYSRGQQPAVIRVTARAAEGEWLVEVHDNGVGFPPDQASRLFGLFQRLHRSSEFEGTGVGLANVQQIVVRHGGRVWAHSRPGEGTTFGFSLPRLG